MALCELPSLAESSEGLEELVGHLSLWTLAKSGVKNGVQEERRSTGPSALRGSHWNNLGYLHSRTEGKLGKSSFFWSDDIIRLDLQK